jgi:hypothetical protein
MRALLVVLFLVGTSAAFADPLHQVARFNLKLETAKLQMKKIISSESKDSLEVWLRKNLPEAELNAADIISEVKKMKIEVDDKSSEAFVHDSQKTWVETGLTAFATIHVRPYSMFDDVEKLNVRDLVFTLFHEIGHHLFGSSESRSWQFANSMIQYFENRLPVPDLLKVSRGSFVSQDVGCRDTMEVQDVDLLKAQVRVTVSTSDGHCRIFRPYMNRYAFDSTKYDLQCESHQDGTFCGIRDARQDYRMCEEVSDRILQQPGSKGGFLFRNGQHVQGAMSYCIFESKKAAMLFEVKPSYTYVGRVYGERKMSEAAVREFDRLERMWVGLSLFIKEAIQTNSVPSLFVDE